MNNINDTDRNGNTRLHFAVLNSNAKTVSKFLRNGANPDIKNIRDKTVYDNALDAKNNSVVEVLENYVLSTEENFKKAVDSSPEFINKLAKDKPKEFEEKAKSLGLDPNSIIDTGEQKDTSVGDSKEPKNLKEAIDDLQQRVSDKYKLSTTGFQVAMVRSNNITLSRIDDYIDSARGGGYDLKRLGELQAGYINSVSDADSTNKVTGEKGQKLSSPHEMNNEQLSECLGKCREMGFGNCDMQSFFRSCKSSLSFRGYRYINY